MPKHMSAVLEREPCRVELAELPRVTRGLRREQEKRRRKRARVEGATLIVGLDLARENQAATFQHGGEILTRSRFKARPRDLDALLRQAEAVRLRYGLERIVVAMEPAGHYWKVAAEVFSRSGVDYVVVHPLSVRRAREETRYTRDKSDPKDADLIAQLAWEGKFTEARLAGTRVEAALNALAREYMLVRKASAAERTRLTNFWDQFLPECSEAFEETTSQTALSIALALRPLSEIASLSPEQWCTRVRQHACGRRIQLSRARRLLPLLQHANADPVRRSTDALPARIRGAAERRVLLEGQKLSLRADMMQRYAELPEAIYLDSIPGSDPFYNALVLGLVGSFADYDDPRAIVKLAGSEISEHASGDYAGRSRISHRGRSLLRAAAYQQARFLVSRNEEFRARFHTLLHRGGRGSELKAYVAIANSYLRTAHVLACTQQLYRSEKRSKEGRG
jgi:transposase